MAHWCCFNDSELLENSYQLARKRFPRLKASPYPNSRTISSIGLRFTLSHSSPSTPFSTIELDVHNVALLLKAYRPNIDEGSHRQWLAMNSHKMLQ